MAMNTVKVFPQTADYYDSSFKMMMYSMVPDFSIVFNRDILPSEGRITRSLDSISQRRYDYPAAQRTSFEVRRVSFPGVGSGEVSIDYHLSYLCSMKEANDLRCSCASLATHLLPTSNRKDFLDNVVKAVQTFVNRNFTYRQSDSIHDHASVQLLRTGEGVCQAIASFASVLLPFMGIPCVNVWGEGSDGFRWERHLWNAVRDENGKWIHVDFTFGMKSPFLASTKNHLSEKLFMKNHRFDSEVHSPEQLDMFQKFIRSLVSAEIILALGKGEFICADRIMVIDEGKVMLDRLTDGRFEIHLTELYRLLGGGVEYVRNKDMLHFVLHNQQKYVTHASRFILPQGSFDIRILNELDIPYKLDRGMLRLQLHKGDAKHI